MKEMYDPYNTKTTNSIDEFHGRIDKEERRKAQDHWDKLDDQTKAIYVQTAATFIPKTVGGGISAVMTLPAEKHIGRIVAYAMKMAYVAKEHEASAVKYY